MVKGDKKTNFHFSKMTKRNHEKRWVNKSVNTLCCIVTSTLMLHKISEHKPLVRPHQDRLYERKSWELSQQKKSSHVGGSEDSFGLLLSSEYTIYNTESETFF